MDDRQFWDLAFISLCSFRAHPGVGREGTKVPSLFDLAVEASNMLEIRRHVWDGVQQLAEP